MHYPESPKVTPLDLVLDFVKNRFTRAIRIIFQRFYTYRAHFLLLCLRLTLCYFVSHNKTFESPAKNNSMSRSKVLTSKNLWEQQWDCYCI